MREGARLQLGFYPAPYEAIALAADHITADEEAVLLDPCAGEGSAIAQLADALNIKRSRIVAGELEYNRSRVLKASLPEAAVTMSVDLMAARATPGCATLMLLNPPFDNETGRVGDRCEITFLTKATPMLAPKGVLVFILPEHRLPDVRRFLGNYYYGFTTLKFPSEVRKYREVIVLAKRRSTPGMDTYVDHRILEGTGGQETYHAGRGVMFQLIKEQYTNDELLKVMNIDKAVAELTGRSKGERLKVRPPLELGMGHVALLLASGHLNGRVHKKGEKPHVVRGVCRKREVEVDKSVSGKETTRVTRESIELVIRKVDETGTIEDITDEQAD